MDFSLGNSAEIGKVKGDIALTQVLRQLLDESG